jgi:hypothetical protein
MASDMVLKNDIASEFRITHPDGAEALTITSESLANPPKSLNTMASSVLVSGNKALDTTQTLGQVTHLYDGTGASNPLATGVGSIDFSVSSNGTGYWHDRTSDCTIKDDGGSVVTSGSIALAVDGYLSRNVIKGRTITSHHNDYDSIRGKDVRIKVNTSDAEDTVSGYLDFTSNGVITSTNDNAVNNSSHTYVLEQTIYTHLKWGVTDGVKWIYAYNPVTGEYMRMREGSNSVISHYTHGKTAYQETKQLNGTNGGRVYYGDKDNSVYLYSSTGSNASAPTNIWNNTEATKNTFTFIGGHVGVNASGNVYIDYGFVESANKTIINYGGTSIIGNKVITKDKFGNLRQPRTLKLKSLSSGNWVAFSAKQGMTSGNDNFTYPNLSNAEETAYDWVDVQPDGFTLPATGATYYYNKLGETYIAIVEFEDETNLDGDGYFDYVTDDSDLAITSGVYTYTNGQGDNGFKRSSETITEDIDFTGVVTPISIENGTFATDTIWTKGVGWTISGGKATKGVSSNSFIAHTFVPTIGTNMTLSFTVSDYIGGTLYPILGDLYLGEAITSNGSYSIDTTSDVEQRALSFFGVSFEGSIDDVEATKSAGVSDGMTWVAKEEGLSSYIFTKYKPSVGLYDKVSADDNRYVFDVDTGKYYLSSEADKIVNGSFDTDSDWVKGTGVSISSGALNFSASSGYGEQVITTVIGQEYKVEYSCNSYTSGNFSLQVRDSGDTTNVATPSALASTGTYTLTFVAIETTTLIKLGIYSSPFTGSMDNVSIYIVEAELGTEVTTPISFLKHPYLVANETPQYEDTTQKLVTNVMDSLYVAKVEAEEIDTKNQCTAWVNFDGDTTIPTIHNDFNVYDVVKISNHVEYDVYFTEPMDNINYTINVNSIYGVIAGVGEKTLTYVTVKFIAHNGTTPVSISDASVQIFGGKA